MSKRYPGGIIRKTPQTSSQTSAQGIWDMASVTQAVKENNWPIAGVPDPVSKSLRFRSSASAYLNRTLTTPTNNKIWTWSGWVKRGILGTATNRTLFRAGVTSPSNGIRFEATTDVLRLFFNDATSGDLVTTQVFRDPAAWYHIIVAVDTTQATAANRVKIYINGTQVTAFSTASYPAQNYDPQINSAILHTIGAFYASATPTEFFDGYMAEVNFVDGQALTPSSFGSTNDQTGVWQPIAYTGTYGTNGFYLPFSNTASTSTLGNDFSGNSNNWTTNNISLTSGSTYDSMVDVPTQWIPYNTAGDTGALFRGNYCVFNPLDRGSTNFTLSNGNLNIVGASASSAVRATMAVSSGKWYWEATPTAIGNGLGVGFAGDSSRFNPATWNAGTYVIYQSDGNKHINGSATSYGSSYTTNDVIGVALDMDAGTITFYKNNVSQGTASTGLTGVYLPVFSQTSGATTGTINANFGAGSGFAYTPPSGFKTLCTTNLSTPTIGATASTTANKYFNSVLYTGNNGTQTIATGFQPDFTWIKVRNVADDHFLYDSVRTATKYLSSNTTSAEGTISNGLTAFASTGFTLGDSGSTNNSSNNYVAWNWKANGSGSSNTAGSITSTVSANTTAGFSIVTYTGTGSAATVGHGLGVTPAMYIVKIRSGANNWTVWHQKLANTTTSYILLDSTAAETTSANVWGSTAATSSTIGVGTAGVTNANGSTYVAYCFSQVAGYSAFGSYTGNGSTDGPFVFTGFRPKYVIVKCSSTGPTNWVQHDTAREPYNLATVSLYPNLSNAETTTASQSMDILSNGFKLRNTSGDVNTNGGTYIYMAFAESPFKFALAR